MAETLFISPDELAGTTILGGNVDPDRYVTNILFVQINTIEPLLGTELYEKITTDLKADELDGKYEEVFDKFIKPITKYQSLAEYIEISPFLVENGGTYKHTADNRDQLTRDELSLLANKYHTMADTYIKRFYKWIAKNNIPEYNRFQDGVNAQKVETKSGMFFKDTCGNNRSWRGTEESDWRIA